MLAPDPSDPNPLPESVQRAALKLEYTEGSVPARTTVPRGSIGGIEGQQLRIHGPGYGPWRVS